MASYNISELLRLSDLLLDSQADLISTTVSATPTAFNLTSSIATEIASAYSLYNTAMQDLEAAEVAYRAAVQLKDARRATLSGKLADYLPICYATPTVTNDELALLGLKPRTPRSPSQPPQIPLDLTATIRTGGLVQLKWKRNGNTSSTTFVVENRIEDGAWETAFVGTRTRVEFTEYAPGVMVSFRVSARKNEEQSVSSNVAVIYDDGGAGELPVAA